MQMTCRSKYKPARGPLRFGNDRLSKATVKVDIFLVPRDHYEKILFINASARSERERDLKMLLFLCPSERKIEVSFTFSLVVLSHSIIFVRAANAEINFAIFFSFSPPFASLSAVLA